MRPFDMPERMLRRQRRLPHWRRHAGLRRDGAALLRLHRERLRDLRRPAREGLRADGNQLRRVLLLRRLLQHDGRNVDVPRGQRLLRLRPLRRVLYGLRI